ncbi:MAG: ABC transporter permease [Proteobacteria bacterium]|jgi:tungstate transport system permease protein|nr:ABC transporter permease [Pseudomonadota bacterium]MBT6348237.1 ABC transporter permease [Pseudomonadota bacterium]MBT7450927.1 ABC transporter permease [Rhodospirillaceae bacterium]MCH1521288.1 ABC transporter permease [Arenicellales bacterium]|tara:strand:+ start:211 stop:933 length:723 start_codon:yes stop_codon:yes gene_type:complete
MQEISGSFAIAFSLIGALDADLMEIVGLSIRVSLFAVGLSLLIGLPAGAAIAIGRFPGRFGLIVISNSLMGMPPVVIGLLVYLGLSRTGPFGVLGLLYTPTAMVIAQTLLITPIVIALARQTIDELNSEYAEYFASIAISLRHRVMTLLWEGRYGLMTVCLAGFGRAISEVGAVMIVGGNIDHLTRVMTTAIALETSKGDLELAMALGIILMLLALTVNLLLAFVRPTETFGKKNAAATY